MRTQIQMKQLPQNLQHVNCFANKNVSEASSLEALLSYCPKLHNLDFVPNAYIYNIILCRGGQDALYLSQWSFAMISHAINHIKITVSNSQSTELVTGYQVRSRICIAQQEVL